MLIDTVVRFVESVMFVEYTQRNTIDIIYGVNLIP